ncbi:MAG TPA: iron-sulfur cluster assembly scaffold protein [Pyrinomonadaceae bacterium]|nr:iron-sulfur cluster assembly scaffold protein [Pyrinomonadaceae bacterium]
MNFYPQEISRIFNSPKNVGKAENTNAVGTGASFVCGAAVRLFLRIEKDTKEILEARFRTNGCGFTIAAADVLAEKILGKKLTELHGLEKESLQAEIEAELDKFPGNRKHCLEICIEALQAALADFRAFQIEEFAGEKALICTCFGISEEAIEKIIAENEIEMVEEVTEISNAGGGCGSCQFLIQEMIDVYWRETR